MRRAHRRRLPRIFVQGHGAGIPQPLQQVLSIPELRKNRNEHCPGAACGQRAKSTSRASAAILHKLCAEGKFFCHLPLLSCSSAAWCVLLSTPFCRDLRQRNQGFIGPHRKTLFAADAAETSYTQPRSSLFAPRSSHGRCGFVLRLFCFPDALTQRLLVVLLFSSQRTRKKTHITCHLSRSQPPSSTSGFAFSVRSKKRSIGRALRPGSNRRGFRTSPSACSMCASRRWEFQTTLDRYLDLIMEAADNLGLELDDVVFQLPPQEPAARVREDGGFAPQSSHSLNAPRNGRAPRTDGPRTRAVPL